MGSPATWRSGLLCRSSATPIVLDEAPCTEEATPVANATLPSQTLAVSSHQGLAREGMGTSSSPSNRCEEEPERCTTHQVSCALGVSDDGEVPTLASGKKSKERAKVQACPRKKPRLRGDGPAGNPEAVDASTVCSHLPEVSDHLRAPGLRAVRRFRNFQEAHEQYGYPSSHRIGTIRDPGTGCVIRSFINPLHCKDVIEDEGDSILYRLKNATIRSWFLKSKEKSAPLRVFLRTEEGVHDLGLYSVSDFVPRSGTDYVHLRRSQALR
mmetsp:Transcript_6371/g.13060  ORF Transcript_6371/g.13060 Transcript_6371/m.13060 type:complete len:268 (-) Transcript_6371:67-870(-)